MPTVHLQCPHDLQAPFLPRPASALLETTCKRPSCHDLEVVSSIATTYLLHANPRPASYLPHNKKRKKYTRVELQPPRNSFVNLREFRLMEMLQFLPPPFAPFSELGGDSHHRIVTRPHPKIQPQTTRSPNVRAGPRQPPQNCFWEISVSLPSGNGHRCFPHHLAPFSENRGVGVTS